MLFQRREPARWPEKLRISVWPRRSWGRSVKYVTKRILRITATPHAIAAGVAAGVFTSFTPFMGFHFIIAAIIAYIIGGNLIASALGTFFGNPLTFPVIWISTYTSGNFILNGGSRAGTVSSHADDPIGAISALGQVDLYEEGFSGLSHIISDIWDPIILPMMVGGIPLGIAFAILFYVLTYHTAKWFRHKRISLIEARALEMKDTIEAEAGVLERATRECPQTEEKSASKAKAGLDKVTKKAREKASEFKEKRREKASDKYMGPFVVDPR